ncbi:MAG TPA: response regulator transcription factor [Gammaproteobacteria bacterium]|nr:response regulator transcription factor [Gammaproteobacteria bacterium]
MPHSVNQTIYVVDDDQAVRESLCWLLESVDLPVVTYASAQEFLANYNPEMGGCLILDVRMPGMSGLELQNKLAEIECTLPILIVTGHGDVPMAVRALKNGAVDFIEKPFNDQKLLERIQHCLDQDRAQREARSMQRIMQARYEQLTPREQEVLVRVVAGKLNKVIATELGISSKTVEAHRANIMEKMHASSLAELVTMCVTVGLR